MTKSQRRLAALLFRESLGIENNLKTANTSAVGFTFDAQPMENTMLLKGKSSDVSMVWNFLDYQANIAPGSEKGPIVSR